MRVSFVIPAHNEAALIARTLGAMHAAADEVIGAGAGEYEVIVVDDSSTDATGKIAASFAPRGARVIRVEHRQISRTRASGARAAVGDLFIFVDADTLINPAVLRAAVAAIDKGAIGGGAAMSFDGHVPLWARVSTEAIIQLFRVLGYTGGCFLYCTRPAYFASGGWDETLFASEEISMCKALKTQGRFVVLRERVTTSGRKLRTHSAREILSLVFKYSIRGQKILRDRKNLDLWYGERREDPPPPDAADAVPPRAS